MHRSKLATGIGLLAGSLTSLAVALAVVLIPSGAAGASTTSGCVAWGAMPTHVTAGRINPTTVHIALHGSAACKGSTADDGATAILRGPDGRRYPMLWSHFGATDSMEFVASLNKAGQYRLIDGNVQTYDASYRHIPATWRTTAIQVRS